WRQLVQVMYLGLAGNPWLIRGYVVVLLVVIILLGPVVQWLIDDRIARAKAWDSLPLIFALLATIKLLLAARVVGRLQRERLLPDRTLIDGAALWCGAVLALFGVFAWFTATPYFPRYVLALIAILLIPLVRLSAAPLALARNRHR